MGSQPSQVTGCSSFQYSNLILDANEKKMRAARRDLVARSRTLFLVGRTAALAARSYFVNMGMEDVGGVAEVGDSDNVSQTFQPAGRFELSNSP